MHEYQSCFGAKITVIIVICNSVLLNIVNGINIIGFSLVYICSIPYLCGSNLNRGIVDISMKRHIEALRTFPIKVAGLTLLSPPWRETAQYTPFHGQNRTRGNRWCGAQDLSTEGAMAETYSESCAAVNGLFPL